MTNIQEPPPWVTEQRGVPALYDQFVPPRKPIKIYHWSELDQLPQPKYLIKGLLDQGGMSVVYGPSNSGKTFIALDLACHIAAGQAWCDMKIRQGAILYVAAEGSAGLIKRLNAIQQHYGWDSREADIYVITANVCLCKDQSEHDMLLSQIMAIPSLKLIVIDTLARSMGAGDENSSSDMGSLIQNCDHIRQQTDAHIMILHHSGKKEEAGARGHSSLKAAIDTEIQVSQSSDIIKAIVTKQRDGQTGTAFGFELKEYEVAKDEDGDPVWSCALVQTEVKDKNDKLNGQAAEAHQVLLNLILESGVDRVPKSGMKKQKCVRIADFKDHFSKAGITETDNVESIGKAFLRAKKTMKASGYISEWDGYVWLLDKPDK